MGYKYRGLALIFGNEFKDSAPVEQRPFVVKDLERMKNLFLYLDFKVAAYKDRNDFEFRKIIKGCKWDFDYDPECFVCVISSHGSEDPISYKGDTLTPVVHAANSIPIRIQDIAKDVCTTLDPQKFKGKPKLFFIQACRTQKYNKSRYDSGIEVPISDLKIDSSGNESEKEATMTRTPDSTDSLLSLGKYKGNCKFQLDPDLESFYKKEELQEGEWDPLGTDVNASVGDTATTMSLTGKDTADAKGRSGAKPPDTLKPPTPNIITLINSPSEPVSGKKTGHRRSASDSKMYSKMPRMTENVSLIECPKDCLIMFPVTAGKAALKSESQKGSWLIYFMHMLRLELIQDGTLLPYLTSVANFIARHKFNPDELPNEAKCAAFVMHRLTDEIVFQPMSDNSQMAKERKRLEAKHRQDYETLLKQEADVA